MVGHTFQFSPAIRLIRDRLEYGDIGQIHYIHSARLNLGLYRPDVNVVWDLAPHDLSIMNFLLRSTPAKVAAWGASIAYPGMEDLAYIQVEYHNPRVTGYIHLSWLDPRKTRTVTIVGSKKMMVYDDLAEERVRIYDKGLEVAKGTAAHEWPISYRYGDITSPHIQMSEPLALQDGHFIECILHRTAPESDGRNAVGIVATLEAIDRALRSGCAEEVDCPQELSEAAPRNGQMAFGCMPK
jgi:predicted dehydrogenase